MLKQAWRSYVSDYYDGKYRYFYRWLLHVFILGLIGAWDIFLYVFQLLPIFVMYWSNMEGGLQLEKTMFLSPMKKREREKYINYLLLFKIGVPLFIGLLVEIIASFLVGIDIYGVTGKMLCYLFAGVGIFIHADGIDKMDGRIVPVRKDKDGKLRWSWMNTITHIVAVFTVVMYDAIYLASIGSKFPLYLLGFSVVLLLIWSTIILRTQYLAMIEFATDYERVNGISVKDRYIVTEQ